MSPEAHGRTEEVGTVVRGGPGPCAGWAGGGEGVREVPVTQVMTGSTALPGPEASSFPLSRLLNHDSGLAWLNVCLSWLTSAVWQVGPSWPSFVPLVGDPQVPRASQTLRFIVWSGNYRRMCGCITKGSKDE